MQCPVCRRELKEKLLSYTCNCGFMVWKKMSGKKITPGIIEQLCKNGYTEVFTFTSKRTGKEFAARLVLKDKKVTYDFPKTQDSIETVYVRVESSKSGQVAVKIGKPVKVTKTINYGLVPTKMSECLGCMTAVRLIKHHFGKESVKQRISLSINNKDFSKYILRERTPRDKGIRFAVEQLWGLLKDFSAWEAQYKPKGRSKLKGSPQVEKFPYKIFPWLNVKTDVFGDDKINVYLPPRCPDVLAQFKASIRSAKPLDEDSFTIPRSSEKALYAWISRVKGKSAHEPSVGQEEANKRSR